KLIPSRYGDEDPIREMLRIFKEKTKVIFDGTQISNIINFGGPHDNDKENNILRGKLILSQLEVCKIFDDVIARIVKGCLEIIQAGKVKHLFLLGSFGESPYLRLRLKEEAGKEGVEVIAVDKPCNANVIGRLVWYVKGTAVASVECFTIGVTVSVKFNKRNDEHIERRSQAFVDSRQVANSRMYWLTK
ncbi:hypothetical protein FRC17_011312, partial [Serendipita sp. 399]